MTDLLQQLEPAPQPVALNTTHARAMLRKRYEAPEWALMEEVAPNTGGGTRYADAVAVNLWSSRGHAVHGVEIKVSRGDWLKELKDPSKAEPVYRYCDYWWILAPKGIVKDGELPPTWGLLELRTNGIVTACAAPKLEPKPLTRAFFASIMRRGHEQLESRAGQLVHEEIAKARGEINKRVEEGIRQGARSQEALQDKVHKFEEATGLRLDSYSGPPIETIRLAQRLRCLQGWSTTDALGKVEQIAKELDSLSAALRKVADDTGLRGGGEPAA